MIYVDNMDMPARVGRYDTVWCHLITDNPDLEELHLFAEKIGLKRSYFQDKRYGPKDPGRPHYDVTPNVKKKAIENGAVEIEIDQVHDVMEMRRERIRRDNEPVS
jgi:hypothetical protein